jgi:hypothetical protein
MSSIFLCYRRADAAGYAGRLFDALRRSFGEGAVFRDVDSIETASRFPDTIRREIDTCRVFIPIIGPAWLRGLNQSPADGADGPEDWVQLEIAAALERNVCIIPVTVGGAAMPSPRELPVALRALAERQCRDLRDGDTWNTDVGLLEKRISRELGTAPRMRQAGRRAVVVAVAALSMALAAAAYWTRREPEFDMGAEPVIVFEIGNKDDVTERPQGPPADASFATELGCAAANPTASRFVRDRRFRAGDVVVQRRVWQPRVRHRQGPSTGRREPVSDAVTSAASLPGK